MTMWVHYSNNNIGFCVSYDMKVNIGLSNCTFPVQCTDIRLDVTNLLRVQTQKTSDAIDCQTISGNKEIILDDFTIVFISCLLCNLKHTSGSYEQKFRCTAGAITEGMPFIDARPKEIFIGMNCVPRHTKRLIEIASSWKLPIYRMEFNECSEHHVLTARNMNDRM